MQRRLPKFDDLSFHLPENEMILTIEHRDQRFRCDTSQAISLAITMDFEGPQPNHFGTEKAKQEILKLGSFTGDTESGGSCNVKVLHLIPHCNGTHTETISHIVNEDIWIGHAAKESLMVAVVITVKPMPVERLSAVEKNEGYRPPLDPTDSVITFAMIDQAIKRFPKFSDIAPQALIIRTLPNETTKKTFAYGETHQPPFLTVEAMEKINQLAIQHLLVDFPSVDRMYDDGLLTNHHLFWNVKEGEHVVNAESRQDKTITEMVFVGDDLKDGLYILNLQIPAFGSDAAPSRPILFPATIAP